MVFEDNIVIHADFDGDLPPLALFEHRRDAKEAGREIKRRYELKWFRTVPCVLH